MKKGTYVLIIFLIFFFLILTTIVAFIYYELGRPPSVKAQSYLEMNLFGEIQEKACPNIFTAMFMDQQSLSMYDIWTNLQKAEVDNRIKAIVLHLGYLQCSWAKINELREAFLDFRKSGKKIYVFIDEAPEFDKEYYLATACDQIILHPLGWLGVNGIGGYVPFLKNTLDKLGIEAEIEHVEEYKTAYNMFTEEGFTPAHREMLESIYSTLFSQYVKGVAEARGKSEEEIKKIIDHGSYQGEEALKAGLVDKLLFEDELANLIKEEHGQLSRISNARYSKIKPSSLGLAKGKKIALIYGMGSIHTGESYYNQTIGSKTMARWIKKARKDKSIAAVVLRVDSPGGSAVASDTIWREEILTKKEKPFVVSMSDLAGSGGYWISMAAHKIVAQPQSFTGSIGVISGKFNMIGLYDKLGISAERLTYGKRADLYSTFRKFTPEERELLKREILNVYDRFLVKVAEGRNMTKEDVNKIGKGRVWTGSQAKEIGLVDEVGGLTKAIELAKELAGIPSEEKVRFVVWPKKVSFLAMLMGKKEAGIELGLDPRVEKILTTFKRLEKDKNWAIMPFWIAPE